MENQDILLDLLNNGELPTLNTVVYFDDSSILKASLAVAILILIAYILFKYLPNK